MKLKEAIQLHMVRTGERQFDLAKRAGVFPSVISRILSEKQEDVNGKNYRRIMAAIQDFQPSG